MAATLKNLFMPKKNVVVLDAKQYNELMKRLEFKQQLRSEKGVKK